MTTSPPPTGAATLREFKDDELTDRAAALTYYGVLSLFPALLVLVSLLGITGKSATDAVLAHLKKLAPGLARRAGTALGIGDTALTVWSIAKWPVLVALVTVMIAILYWASPNAKVKGARWITPGSFLALVTWLIASAGFAFYVANFASYNKTYGAMAGVIVVLVWLWITNLAIVPGLEFDAETVRQRAIAGGLPPDTEPYTQPRDTRKWDEDDRRRLGEG